MSRCRPALLIVDDSPTNIRLLGGALGEDYEVRFATSGDEALQLVRRLPPDLVLLDVVMPAMDGYQVCRRLKADRVTRDIPIIFITSAGGDENEIHGFEAGAADYISKPINIPVLRTRIRNQIELHRALSELRLAASVFHNTMEGILVADADRTIIKVNEAFCGMTGYRPEDLLGLSMTMLQSDRHDDSFFDHMWETVRHNGHWVGEVWSRMKNGESHPQLLNLSRVDDGGGGISHFVAHHSDIRFLLDQSRQLERLAYHDALTGLPNRRLLMDRLQQAIAQSLRHRTLLAVAVLDLDGFKPVNDRLGHHAGDAVLVRLAERLSGVLRMSDTVGRLGGDEFVLILPDMEAATDIETVFTRILEAIAEPVSLFQDNITVTASIGVAFCPADGSEPELLLRRADRAMYRAKASGSHCYRIFDAGRDGAVY
ncbi:MULTISPECIES: diguanylate cyclase domain-containing protein [Methylococcus]|uniref:Diguanylate cyclase n=1 Tax=Methylococcus capsulatus TaxID=414 RepID=A0ABZ2F5N5_METCP|nr:MULTISPECIES: diguanylate cyclase [Methylococcus]MDF9393068.1 diguanylate cyclase [Methylococcus capsulatus]